MNIFILDYDIRKCAQYHNNKHLVKMIIESAQLLSSAYYNENKELALIKNFPLDNFLKLTHRNHPCAIWVRESLSNFQWLTELLGELLIEYNFRYNKAHKYTPLYEWFSFNNPMLSDIGQTDFKLAMPAEIKEKYTDPVEAYRQYYIIDKAHLANWGNREKPFWFKEN